MKREIANYQVGVKALIRRGEEFLFLHFNNPSGGSYYDWPGGRIDVGEEDTPLMDILDREIREELGDTFTYTINKPAFTSRRFFPKAGLKIFLVMYETEFVSGEIKLSDEHGRFEWLKSEAVDAKQFVNESEYRGWQLYITTNPIIPMI